VTDLTPRTDLEQLRREVQEVLAAESSNGTTAGSAEHAVARGYGFESWAALVREVERREILDSGDAARLYALIAGDPGLATARMEHWCDHPGGASPLGYTAMRRYDTSCGEWRDVTGTGEMARVLLDTGAPVDGEPGEQETPLITAASYGDAAVALVLIEAGADLEARTTDDSGGVPGGTALLHAAVFGMTEVVDVLVAAGAQVNGIEEAAAAGDVRGWLDDAPADARVRALVMAADHQRLNVIDDLVAAGTPVRRHRPCLRRASLAHRCAERPPREPSAAPRPRRGPEPTGRSGPVAARALPRGKDARPSRGREHPGPVRGPGRLTTLEATRYETLSRAALPRG
jgi:hypothetical protein